MNLPNASNGELQCHNTQQRYLGLQPDIVIDYYAHNNDDNTDETILDNDLDTYNTTSITVGIYDQVVAQYLGNYCA